MNEQERAIVRADCDEIAARMEELRGVTTWWAGLSEERRAEFKSFFASVVLYWPERGAVVY